mmetsp:Transcript_110591/g.308057  ORF Transcript_110591/g.308057 Transcript_110591/m.308057 type:complete len:626 (-) Transcript_110591:124-2001(-)
MQTPMDTAHRETSGSFDEMEMHEGIHDTDAGELRLIQTSGRDAWEVGTRNGRLHVAVLFVVGFVGAGLFAHAAEWASSRSSRSRASAREAILKLAVRSQCSNMDEDCSQSRCCSVHGTQCYEKQSGWAQCRADCVPGRDPADHDPSPWSCKELGVRAPGRPPQPDYTIQPAPWVMETCSAAGENCNITKCCQEKGKQCFKKANGWASCKAECVPGGPDPVDADNHPWDCQALGMRTPGAASGWGRPGSWVSAYCSDTFENCKQTKCCKVPGHQCYKKTDAWSMCLPTCTHGPLLTDADPRIWNCTPLGGRTPGIAKVRPQKVAEWVKTTCSKYGHGVNCIDTMCCSRPTLQCYARDDTFASCYRGCVQGTNPYDKDGGNWSCEKLGTRTPRRWKTPSLYCFHVMMVNSYEAKIVRQELAIEGGVGIFACEQYDVFAGDGEAWLGDGPLGVVRTHHFTAAPVGKSIDGTAANTALFRNVWEAIKFVGRYKLTDWTIKVDPDAVVFPQRLRAALAKHITTNPRGQYIINCNKKWMKPMMFGSLEAISREALETYFDKEGECKEHVDTWGEDRWLGFCLDKLGVNGTEDFDLVGDKVCKGANCGDGKAAYHHFKDTTSWKKCYLTATR